MTINDEHLAVQFPGQGAQEVGMGEDLYREEPLAKRTFNRADDVLDYSISEICFEGPEETLTETRHSQPGILVTSIAFYRVLQEELESPLEPVAVAGLSLGEYSSLVAAGAIRFEDALRVVQVRAEAMQEDCDRKPSGMVSVLGLTRDEAEEVVEEASEHGVISIANVNSARQIVISGDLEALEKAQEIAEDHGAKRTISLDVAGAFHSPLMEPASEKLREALEDVEIRSPEIPVVTNTTGKQVSDPDEIRNSLAEQVTSPVLWEPTLQTLTEMDVQSYLEVGPGRVLSGLAKKVNREAETMNIQSLEDLRSFL